MTWAGNTRTTRKTGSPLPVIDADDPMSVQSFSLKTGVEDIHRGTDRRKTMKSEI